MGGVGPYASAVLFERIVARVPASVDQDHPHISLLSFPGEIPDRTTYLLNTSCPNPLGSVLTVIDNLLDLGAQVIGIPCNTLHAPAFVNDIEIAINRRGGRFVNMVKETVDLVACSIASGSMVCALSTTGAVYANVYGSQFASVGVQAVTLPSCVQDRLHEAIYNPEYGLKHRCSPPTRRAIDEVNVAIDAAIENGAETIVLACSELSAVSTSINSRQCPLIDPLTILAEELIRQAATGHPIPDIRGD